MSLAGFPRDVAIAIVTGRHAGIDVVVDEMDEWGVHHCTVTNGNTQLSVDYTINEAGVHMFTLGLWPEVNFRVAGTELDLETDDPAPVEQYICSITWSPFAGDWEKLLVAGHLRRYAMER